MTVDGSAAAWPVISPIANGVCLRWIGTALLLTLGLTVALLAATGDLRAAAATAPSGAFTVEGLEGLSAGEAATVSVTASLDGAEEVDADERWRVVARLTDGGEGVAEAEVEIDLDGTQVDAPVDDEGRFVLPPFSEEALTVAESDLADEGEEFDLVVTVPSAGSYQLGLHLARAEPEVGTVDRMSGAGRIETAVRTSQAAFPDGADVAYIAYAGEFADALTGGPTAGLSQAPILLTWGDELPTATERELERLDVDRVVVLGGTAAVSEPVEARIAELVDGVERLAGVNRFDTAGKIALDRYPDGADVVYVATGLGFADALAGGPAAGAENAPILLTGGDALPPVTVEALDALAPRSVVILGGEAVVDTRIAEELSELVGDVERRAGAGRFDTAVQISEAAFGPDAVDTVHLATGDGFADALTGTPAAIASGGPLLLSPGNEIPDVITEEIERLDVAQVTLLGGVAALSEGIAADADASLGDPVPTVDDLEAVDEPHRTEPIEVPDPDEVATIAGVVVDADDGSPLSDAAITIVADDEVVTNTGDDGTFSQQVPPDDYTVTTTADGYFDATIEDVTASAGEQSDLTVEMVSEAASVAGQVSDIDTGEGIPEATVTLSGDPSTEEATTSDDGGYLFDDVSPGDYHVSFEADGYQSETAEISVEAGDTVEEDATLTADEPDASPTVELLWPTKDAPALVDPVDDQPFTVRFVSEVDGEYTVEASSVGEDDWRTLDVRALRGLDGETSDPEPAEGTVQAGETVSLDPEGLDSPGEYDLRVEVQGSEGSGVAEAEQSVEVRDDVLVEDVDLRQVSGNRDVHSLTFYFALPEGLEEGDHVTLDLSAAEQGAIDFDEGATAKVWTAWGEAEFEVERDETAKVRYIVNERDEPGSLIDISAPSVADLGGSPEEFDYPAVLSHDGADGRVHHPFSGRTPPALNGFTVSDVARDAADVTQRVEFELQQPLAEGHEVRIGLNQFFGGSLVDYDLDAEVATLRGSGTAALETTNGVGIGEFTGPVVVYEAGNADDDGDVIELELVEAGAAADVDGLQYVTASRRSRVPSVAGIFAVGDGAPFAMDARTIRLDGESGHQSVMFVPAEPLEEGEEVAFDLDDAEQGGLSYEAFDGDDTRLEVDRDESATLYYTADGEEHVDFGEYGGNPTPVSVAIGEVTSERAPSRYDVRVERDSVPGSAVAEFDVEPEPGVRDLEVANLERGATGLEQAVSFGLVTDLPEGEEVVVRLGDDGPKAVDYSDITAQLESGTGTVDTELVASDELEVTFTAGDDHRHGDLIELTLADIATTDTDASYDVEVQRSDDSEADRARRFNTGVFDVGDGAPMAVHISDPEAINDVEFLQRFRYVPTENALESGDELVVELDEAESDLLDYPPFVGEAQSGSGTFDMELERDDSARLTYTAGEQGDDPGAPITVWVSVQQSDEGSADYEVEVDHSEVEPSRVTRFAFAAP